MIRVANPELAEKFDRMKQEVFLLQIHRKIYDRLFNVSQERINILNRCAPEVFISFQISLEAEMIMLLSRITDAPGIKDKKRLSFQQLHEFIAQSGDDELSKKLRKTIKKIRKIREAVKEYRDKHLAHLDLKTSMREVSPPDAVTLSFLDEAIENLHEYMQTFEQHHEPGTAFMYKTNWVVNSAADHLVSVLEKGLRNSGDTALIS